MEVFLILVITIMVWAYYYITKNFNIWENAGVPSLTPPTFRGAIKGSFLGFPKDLYTFAPEEPYIGIVTMSSPAISVRDPELIRNVLAKDFNHFQLRGAKKFNEKWDPLSANLFFLEGRRWRLLRAKLTPIASSGNLRRMSHQIQQCANEMINLVSACTDASPAVDMKNVISRCVIDIVLTCAFGFQGTCLKDPDDIFLKMLKLYFRMTPYRYFRMHLMNSFPVLLKIIPPEKETREVTDFILHPFLAAVTERKLTGERRNDLIDILIEIQKTGSLGGGLREDGTVDPTFEFTDNLMAAQAWGFLIAGAETSSNTLSFAIVEIANNITIQDRLRKELNDAIKRHGGLTYDALKDLVYMEQVFFETLRMYPALRTLKREVSEKYTMPDGRVTLPVGTRVFINVSNLHMDPKYYPDPEIFDPERFTLEARLARNKYLYLPFGEGPRICPGLRFAFLQMRTILASFLLEFEIRPKPGVPYPPVLSEATIMSTLKYGAPVLISKISAQENKTAKSAQHEI